MADLGRWLSEDYRVPDEAPSDRPEGDPNRRRSDDIAGDE
jgi:endogenous inhibitor of DNA gyrase (YacG/DUF329 family)